MFSLSSSQQYYFYPKACDMRKGFDGLSGLVTNELGKSPISGEVFVFVNKHKNLIKLLHWESGCLVIYHKRLEKGTFAIPKIQTNASYISWPNLVLLIEGIVVQKSLQKTRFCLKK